MNDALAQWLALRERADTAARAERLTRTVARAVAAHDPVRVLDLATGTGANIRYLVARLGKARQHWLAVDRSAALLEQLLAGMSAWGTARGYIVTRNAAGCFIESEHLACQIETRQLDLGNLDATGLFDDRHLVTASALLDLVSEQWLRSLAARCRDTGATGLFTITYNGSSSSVPNEPEDHMVLELFNRHQRTDKGLGGPAAGPDAAACAARCFADMGYHIDRERSDWTIDARDTALQRELIEGWAYAATEIAPDATSTIASWRTRRLQHVEAGRSRLMVGHEDIAAVRGRR
jgi:SAM-dependent methyltransferase